MYTFEKEMYPELRVRAICIGSCQCTRYFKVDC